MTPDIKAIRAAAEAEHFALPETTIALCDLVDTLQADCNEERAKRMAYLEELEKQHDELERLRLPDDWYPQSKDWRDSPSERGEWLYTMYEQAKRRNVELEDEVERLRHQLATYEKNGVTCQTFGHELTGCAECNRDDNADDAMALDTMQLQARQYFELLPEVERLRNGMFNIANQSTEPAIQEFARSYLGDKL